MPFLWITVGAAALLAAAALIISLICFRITFYVPPRRPIPPLVPEGETYRPFREKIECWAAETAKMPHKEYYITTFDGLRLYGRFYEYKAGAPIELMFHGYRGTAERDLSGGVQRCFKLGRSAFIVDQRCSGNSEGKVITFGIKEYKDCLCWIDFLCKEFGPEVKIILTGISMGAATVLMAGSQPLPPNVIGILADCGYDSAKNIIQKVIRGMGLPVGISYFFVRLGARIYGGFDPEETSPRQELKKCTLPVIFFHGESDDFVPAEMSRINFDVCPSRKKLVIVPDADHGLSYPKDPEKYLAALRDFFGPDGSFDE